jgi:sphinganine C4-monooxygenase
MSDSALALVAPLVVYWVYSLFFHFLSKAEFPWIERYRIHEPEEMKRNKVSVKEVIQGVILQQVLQTILGFLVLDDEETSITATILTADRIASVISNLLRALSIKQHLITHFGSPAYMDTLLTISSALQYYIIPAMQFFLAM